jgi:hypothetical protein
MFSGASDTDDAVAATTSFIILAITLANFFFTF